MSAPSSGPDALPPGARSASKAPTAMAGAGAEAALASSTAVHETRGTPRETPASPAMPVPPAPSFPAPVTLTGAFPSLELAQEPPFRWPSLRAPIAMFLLLVLVAGVVYPGAMTLLADEIAPVSTHELFLLVGENISNPALFWERPSQIDWVPIYNATLGTGAGSESPYGPVDPALVNQTEQYIEEYGLGNVTVPLDLVSPSASGLDPDVYPDAALVQIPRVVHFSGLPQSLVWTLVNASITAPEAGIVGPYFVDVISLDQSLLSYLPAGTPVEEAT